MRLRKMSARGLYLVQYQIPQTNVTRTVWQTVRRITDEILGVNGLSQQSSLVAHPAEAYLGFCSMKSTPPPPLGWDVIPSKVTPPSTSILSG